MCIEEHDNEDDGIGVEEMEKTKLRKIMTKFVATLHVCYTVLLYLWFKRLTLSLSPPPLTYYPFDSLCKGSNIRILHVGKVFYTPPIYEHCTPLKFYEARVVLSIGYTLSP